jgi:hypothetical protein
MRQDVYRVAYDEANAELNEILGRFEQLKLRKDRIEKVVEVLKPLVGIEAQVAAEESAAQPESEPAYQPQAAEPVAVQRRAEGTFGIGSVAKDVREYSRLFNGGDSR